MVLPGITAPFGVVWLVPGCVFDGYVVLPEVVVPGVIPGCVALPGVVGRVVDPGTVDGCVVVGVELPGTELDGVVWAKAVAELINANAKIFNFTFFMISFSCCSFIDLVFPGKQSYQKRFNFLILFEHQVAGYQNPSILPFKLFSKCRDEYLTKICSDSPSRLSKKCPLFQQLL